MMGNGQSGLGMDFGERLEHAHLVGGARASAGQDQTRASNIPPLLEFTSPTIHPFSRRTTCSHFEGLWSPPCMAVTASVCAQTPAAAPAEGTAAPALKLQDQAGKWQTLEQYKGKWVVLYFYPKDFTGGCTTQACELRDNIFAFKKADAVILGVSVDDVGLARKIRQGTQPALRHPRRPDARRRRRNMACWRPTAARSSRAARPS